MARPAASLKIDWQANSGAGFYDALKPKPGVVSIWRMNDSSGSVLADSVGALAGNRIGSPSLVTGPYPYDSDQALRFNGSSQLAEVPHGNSLTLVASWEFAGWYKPRALPGGGTTDEILSKGSVRASLLSSGKIQFQVTNDQSGTLTTTTLVSNTTLQTDVWYYLSFAYTIGVGLTLGINGIQEATAAHTVGTELSSAPLIFSARRNGTGPSLRSYATGKGDGTLQTTQTCNKPAGVQTGDLLIAQFNHRNDGTIATFPTNWFVIKSEEISGTGYYSSIWGKWVDGTEGSSFSWTTTSGVTYALGISAWSGVDSTYPFANPIYSFNYTNSHPALSRSHLPYNDNTIELYMLSAQYAGTDNNMTWTGPTELYDIGSISFPGPGITLAYLAQTDAASTSASVDKNTPANINGSIHTLVLNGTGYRNHTQSDFKDWSFRTAVPTSDEEALLYEARLGGEGTLTDISDDLVAFSSKVGRKYERDTFESGTFSFTARNKHRNYDPSNKNSPYWPNVLPLRRTVAKMIHNSVEYPIMEGYPEGWPTDMKSPNYDEPTIPCSDGYEILAQADVIGDIPAALSGAQINRLLDLAGWPANKRAIDSGVYYMVPETFEAGSNTKALSVLKEVAESELGIFFIDKDGKATFHDRDHRFTTTRSLVSQATFEDVDSGVSGRVFYEAVKPSFDKTRIANQWVVEPHSTVVGGTPQIVIDPVSEGKYRPRTQTKTTRLDSNAAALEIARALMNGTADPAQRFDSITIKPYDDNSWTKCLSLFISDRVTVMRNPIIGAGGTSTTEDFFIEGISWDLTGGGEWVVEFDLSPVSTYKWYRTIRRANPVSFYRGNIIGSLKDEMQVNYGTISGSPTLITPGPLPHDTDSAVAFPSGASGSIPDSPSISLPVGAAGGIAIEILLRVAGYPAADEPIVQKTGSFEFGIKSNGKLYLTLTGTGSVTVTTNNAISTNTWHTLAFVYNGDYSGVAKLGKTSVGAARGNAYPDYRAGVLTNQNNLQVSRFQALEKGVVSQIVVDLKTERDAPSPEDVCAVAYADASALPGAKLFQTEGQLINTGANVQAWVPFPASFVIAPFEYYWLGIAGGAEHAADPTVLTIGYDSTGGSYKAKNSVVSEGGAGPANQPADDPFGTPAATQAWVLGVYADYTPARTGEEGRALIYVDGQLENYGAYTGGIADSANAVSVLPGSYAADWKDLVFHNRKLNGAEVAEHFWAR